MINQLNLLKSKRFLPLFITQFCGAFNDNAFRNALLVWFTYNIAIKSGFSAQLVTVAAGVFILPFLIFSTIAGQVADKYEKSKLAQILNILDIMLFSVGAVCFYFQNIYSLLAVLFLLGTQATFFIPLKYSLLPEHLADNELMAGNGLIKAGTFFSILSGALFGSLIVHLDNGILILCSFVIILAVIGWFSSCAIPKSFVENSDLKINWNIVTEIRNLLTYARKEYSVWLAIIGISWLWLIVMTLFTQFPHYVRDVLGGKKYVVTLFLIVFLIGIGIGSVWCHKLLKGQINTKLVPLGSFGITVFMLDFYFASNAYVAFLPFCDSGQLCINPIGIIKFFNISIHSWRIVIDVFLIAICLGVYVVPLYAIIQHRSEHAYRARIVAINNFLNSLFMLFATALAFILYSLNYKVIDVVLALEVINVIAFVVILTTVTKKKLNIGTIFIRNR